jgi:hypothetical protein
LNLLLELKALKDEIKKLDFKVTFILLSVAVITFISIVFASPNFYYDHIGKDRLMSRVYWFLTDGAIMFILPVICIKVFLKGKLSDFGFTLGDKKFGIITVVIFLAVMIPVLWIASASEQFADAYPQGGSAVRENLNLFLLYEFCILIYMLGWEFLWRGYMLFGLKSKFGYYTIFIQMIPFFILHKGKPEIELFASIVAGIILGIQALRSRSFIYCWILHFLVMFTIDAISIFRYMNKFYDIF